MTIIRFKSDLIPEIGFAIQVDKDISLWIDEFESGEAYITDWNYVDDFSSTELAYNYIIEKCGKITKL